MGPTKEDQMMCLAFVLMIPLAVLAWTGRWRRAVSILLLGVFAMTMLFPAPIYAQFGLIGGIQNVLSVINGAVRGALNSIGAVARTIESFHQQIVWPTRLIQQARSVMASLIDQYRGRLRGIHGVAVQSATLSVPSELETIVRNRETTDFAALTQSYYRLYGSVPAATAADPMARNLVDIDDALVLNTLKTLKASDRIGGLILQSGDRIEDESRLAAPGSAPFLTSASMAANIQSHAMMQKLFAAMIRQEAARIAHENTVRKRYGVLLVKAREDVSGILGRR
jgi:hypothetical protein